MSPLSGSGEGAPSPPSPLRGGNEGGGPSVDHKTTPTPALLGLWAKRRYPPLKGRESGSREFR